MEDGTPNKNCPPEKTRAQKCAVLRKICDKKAGGMTMSGDSESCKCEVADKVCEGVKTTTAAVATTEDQSDVIKEGDKCAHGACSAVCTIKIAAPKYTFSPARLLVA